MNMAANAPLAVHPAAECFRLMTEEELSALAADIGANGQHDPIILGKLNGSEVLSIVDGRNRAKACGLAGVVPLFETREFKDDDEVRAFVKSRSERRDLSKGERAIGLALLYPSVTEKGGRGNKGSVSQSAAETAGVSDRRIRQARQVLRFSTELAHAVRDGVIRLDDALAKITAERTTIDTAENKLSRLRSSAPDLAELVAEERMSTDDAIAALDKREQVQAAELKNKREVQMRLAEALYRGAIAFSVPEFVDEVGEHLSDDPEYCKEFFKRLRFDPATIADIKKGADHLSKTLKALLGKAAS